MSIMETIVRRRGIGKMTAERPTRKQIEQILEAGTHAPNHHNAQPWRFFVLAGEARAQVGAIMAYNKVDLTELEAPKNSFSRVK